MLIGMVGFYQLKKQQPQIFFALFIYFIINLYIVSSWSCWWYAQSFSQRSLIASYPVMAINMGFFLKWVFSKNKFIQLSFALFALFCLILNLFQSAQFYKGILNGDRMTKAYYEKVFFKLNVDEKDKNLLLVERSFSGVNRFSNEYDYQKRDVEIMNFENQCGNDTSCFFEGKSSFRLDTSLIYSPVIQSKYKQLTNKDHAWIRATAMVYIPQAIKEQNFSVVFNFEYKAYPYAYSAFDSEQMKLNPGKWNKIEVDYLTPEVRSVDDNLKVYFYLRGKDVLWIDNFKVEVFEPK
jgi:hypothetical protein